VKTGEKYGASRSPDSESVPVCAQ